VEQNGVKIIGPANLPSQMAGNASALYAKNLQNLVELLVDEEGNLKIDTGDEVVVGSLLTKDGEIVNERAKEAAGAASGSGGEMRGSPGREAEEEPA
jgi:proton-translocating NAD(P)+ transhydrogenase subunit alpha